MKSATIIERRTTSRNSQGGRRLTADGNGPFFPDVWFFRSLTGSLSRSRPDSRSEIFNSASWGALAKDDAKRGEGARHGDRKFRIRFSSCDGGLRNPSEDGRKGRFFNRRKRPERDKPEFENAVVSFSDIRAVSSAVEHCPYKAGVRGSNPLPPRFTAGLSSEEWGPTAGRSRLIFLSPRSDSGTYGAQRRGCSVGVVV